jgi:hypothetical protein
LAALKQNPGGQRFKDYREVETFVDMMMADKAK